MTEGAGAPLYGNDPADIWDDGYECALLGRSRDANPFRNGDAERAAQPVVQDPDVAALMDGVDPTLGHEEGSTPGSSTTAIRLGDEREPE